MPQGSTSAADEYRERSAQSWELSASGWEAKRAQTRRTFSVQSDWIRRALDLHAGMTVLELACGPGDMAAELAPAVAPSGRWLATDRSANMVAAAVRSAAAAGLAEVIEPAVQDAEQLSLADASVDAVACRFGLMLVPDPAAIMRQVRRVLRPGGACAFVVWATAGENPWVSRLTSVLEPALGAPPPDPSSPGMFALADRSRLLELATGPGLHNATVEQLDLLYRYASFEEYWETQSALSFALRSALPTLAPAQVEELLADVRDALAEFRAEDGSYELPGRTLCLRAEA